MAQGLVHYFFSDFPVPPQVFLAAFSFACLAAGARFSANDYFAVKTGLLAALFILHRELSVHSNLLHMNFFFQLGVGMIIYVTAVHLARRERMLKKLLQILFVMVCLNAFSGMAEILFHFHLPWSCFKGTRIHEAVGLEWFPVSLGYALAAPVAVAGYRVLCRKASYADPGFWLSLFTFALGIAVLLLSRSRSALLGILAGLSVVFLFAEKKRRSAPLLLAFLAFVLAVSIAYLSLNPRKIDLGHDPRLGKNWRIHIQKILANPFADPEIKTHPTPASRTTSPGALPASSATPPAPISPHNTLLSVGRLYGLFPMLLLLALYLHVLWKWYRILKANGLSPRVHTAAAGMYAGIIAFLVQSNFHNAGLFLGEMRNWIYFGIFCSIIHETR